MENHKNFFLNKQKIDFNKMDSEVTQKLILTFRLHDARQKKKLQFVYWLLFAAALCLPIAVGLNPILISEVTQLITANVFVVLLVIIALILRTKYIHVDKTDYTLPLIKILKKTERKYRFWNSEWIFIVVLIMLINILVSIIFSFINLPVHWTQLQITLLAQSVFLPLLIFVCLYEWVTWNKNRKPTWKKTRGMIDELENVT